MDTHRRNKRLAILLVILTGSTAGLLTWRSGTHPKRFAVVETGKLYRSAQPDTRQIDRLIKEVGLKSIVIARSGQSDRVPNEAEFANNRGLNVIHLEIESQKAIAEEHVQRFLECMDHAENLPVLVHCSAGRHRTGYLCARYRIDRQGWSVEQAVEELLSFGFDQNDHQAILEQLRAYKPEPTQAAARSIRDGGGGGS